MACECRNSDGSLSGFCLGNCVRNSIIQQEENAKRDPLQGFAELVLAQVEQRIINHMNILRVDLEKEKLDVYKKAFLEGINEGIAIAIAKEFDF